MKKKKGKEIENPNHPKPAQTPASAQPVPLSLQPKLHAPAQLTPPPQPSKPPEAQLASAPFILRACAPFLSDVRAPRVSRSIRSPCRAPRLASAAAQLALAR